MRTLPSLLVKLLPAFLATTIACGPKQPNADTMTADSPTAAATSNVTVLSVRCTVKKGTVPELTVTADGEVPTGGWTSPMLKRRVYVAAPADSIWEYDFIATPPSGMATQAITPITATDLWQGYPAQQVMGIRVFGEGNAVKQVRLSECTTQ